MQKNLQLKEELRTKKRDPLLIYGIILTASIAIIGGATENTLVAFIFIIAAMPLVFRPEYLIGPILFLTVFDADLIAFPEQSYGRFFVYWFLAGTLFSLISKKCGIKLGTPVLCAVVLAVVATASSVKSSSLPLSYVFSILLFVCLVHTVADIQLLKKQIWCFSSLSIVYSVYFLLRNGLEVFSSGKVHRLEGSVNSNDLAMGIAVTVVLIVALFVINGFKHKLVNGGLALVGIVALFLTGSRSAMIGAVCGIVVVILAWARITGRRLSRAIVVLVLGGAVFWIAYSLLLKYVPAVLEGFTVDDVVESGGSGRVEIWQMFFDDVFPQYWFAGVGFSPDSAHYGSEAVEAVAHGAHNILVEILSTMGILGLCIYVICFSSAMKKMWTAAKMNMAVLVPLAMFFCCVANGIGENMAGRRILWMSLGIGIAMSNLLRQKRLAEEVRKAEESNNK